MGCGGSSTVKHTEDTIIKIESDQKDNSEGNKVDDKSKKVFS